MAEWTATASRFVAFLDIMGFRDRVFRNDHESVLATIQSFQPTLATIEDLAQERLHGDTRKDQPSKSFVEDLTRESVVRPIFFSDSILLASNDDSVSSAWLMLTHVIIVMTEAMESGIPLKGAIAYGQQTDDFGRSLHFGRPLIDAYELQNEICLYGVALHHSAQSYLTTKKMMAVFDGSLIHTYATPLKSGLINHYLVNVSPKLLKDETRAAVVSKFYGTVSGSPRIYVDNTEKYLIWLAEKERKASGESSLRPQSNFIRDSIAAVRRLQRQHDQGSLV